MDPLRKAEAQVQAKRAELSAMLTRATAEGRALSGEEAVAGERISAALSLLEADLKREQAAIEFDRYHATPIAGPGVLEPTRRERGAPGASATYRDLFGAVARDEHFPHATDFFEAVASGRWHPGLRAAMNEGTGSEGGFLTPSEYVAAAFDDALETEVVRPRARVYAMASDTLRVSGFAADGDAATGPFGFAPSWTGEGASITPSNPLVRRVNLTAKKLALLVQASNELVEDGQTYGQQIDRVMRNAIGWSLDYAFLQGNGAGEPLGVLNAPATISVAKESGQAAATIVAPNIYKMYARLLPSPGAYQRAVWVCSPTVIPQLFQLSIPVGVAGTALASIPSLFQSVAGKMTLLNVPVIPSEKMPTLGAAGDIALCDFAYYAVGLRKEVTLDRSQHLGFQSDLASFRAILRADGMPLLSQAYQPKAGDTLSPFTKLGARA